MESLRLDGTWWLTEFDRGEGERQGAFAEHFRLPPERTIPACVPGVVHLALMQAGKLPDPFYRCNEEVVRWVEEREWWYRCEFHLPGSFLQHDEVELVFHGLDTVATVWLNGERVGECDNMFIPHRFSVKHWLREGNNVLVVRLDSPTRVAEEREQQYGSLHASFYRARPYLRKAQYATGWDWGPRLATSGIWRSVELQAYNIACLRSVWGYVTALSEDRSAARVRVEAEIHAVKEAEGRIRFQLQRGSQHLVACVPVTLSLGNQTAYADLTVLNPQLWFPHSVGEQPLYDLRVGLEVEEQKLDEHRVRIGLRTVELVREPDEEGESFLFRINGEPVFCKGANWVPADNFLPRLTKEHYRKLLQKAVDAHMNMLRVWGGGIYEDECFYDLCDELGLMVWQDFMFSCAEYPEETWFHDQVRTEAEAIVKQLRHHPSIVLWCGNNENDWFNFMKVWGQRDRFYGETVYAQILPEVCQRLDPSRPYWQSSPFGGDDPNSMRQGDRHSWEVWFHGDFHRYLQDTGRFISEFGFQAPPVLETIETFTAPEDRYPNSRVMEHHNKCAEGTQRIYRFMAGHFKVPGDFADWVWVAQLLQGEALKLGITHWRRRKFKTAGTLFWQLNDCWPVVSWSVVDYFGFAKAGYYFVRRAFAPLLITVIPEKPPTLWLVNDAFSEVRGTATARIQDVWGTVLWEHQEEITVPANSAIHWLTVSLPEGFDPSRHFIAALFYLPNQSEPVSYDVAFLAPYNHVQLPKAYVTMEVFPVGEGVYGVRLYAPMFVKGVCLRVVGDPAAEFSDNAFDLLPNMERVITVQPTIKMSLADFQTRLQTWHYAG